MDNDDSLYSLCCSKAAVQILPRISKSGNIRSFREIQGCVEFASVRVL